MRRREAYGGIVQGKQKGFSYSVDPDQIERYRIWPLERQFRWLFQGNKLRRSLPPKIVAIQEAFRKGKRD
jgi:hypothetical protein